jgi:regulatory subunit for Cdc7p protein kinase
MDDTNFLQLDYVLGRVKRRTVQEVNDEQRERETRRKERDVDRDEGPNGMFYAQSPQDQTIRQEVWEGDIEMDREGYVDLDND